ncbi:MAG: universal stress protein [Dehalococcoidia bacterium]|nr:universal stress protein [Dehalococcoidia bacterium]
MIVLVPVPLDDPNMAPAVMPSVRRLAVLSPGSEIRLMSVLDPKSVHGVASSEAGDAPPAVVGTRMMAPATRPRVVESHGEAQERMHVEAAEALEALAHKELDGVAVTVSIVWSQHPADKIVDVAAAEAVDVIVMATHGRTGLSHFLSGSVAEAVIRKADRPVLVIGPNCAT